ncbi:unnamed protein product, partial [Adineta steineri]
FGIYTLPNQGYVYCKARTFFTYIPLSASSCVRIRSFSQVKVSQRTICSFICSSVSQFCNTFNDYSLLIFYSLLPPICMFLFGWMTIQHVHNRPINRALNIKDRQLTIMLIFQVLLFQILLLPISIHELPNYSYNINGPSIV